ncbi:hypothetical protein BDB01DRAFT_9303 [Pilobolus umbonatus]|nr:hypothetical protein BDB01DRAFT_9303 [Pilobolus umbonatus]
MTNTLIIKCNNDHHKVLEYKKTLSIFIYTLSIFIYTLSIFIYTLSIFIYTLFIYSPTKKNNKNKYTG